jgi:NADH:ubiquinone oxidoreductase subunit 6 (subunit J)
MTSVAFGLLAPVLVAFALGVVLSRSLYRAAYCLAGALAATAGLYLLLTAPLVAAVQLLLYTGGVLTLVVFALVITPATDDPQRWRRPLPALILSALVSIVLVVATGRSAPPAAASGGLGDGALLGTELFSRYLVPFELLSLLLLAAIFGALAIARREDEA